MIKKFNLPIIDHVQDLREMRKMITKGVCIFCGKNQEDIQQIWRDSYCMDCLEILTKPKEVD